jgi:hypothetical protein
MAEQKKSRNKEAGKVLLIFYNVQPADILIPSLRPASAVPIRYLLKNPCQYSIQSSSILISPVISSSDRGNRSKGENRDEQWEETLEGEKVYA